MADHTPARDFLELVDALEARPPPKDVADLGQYRLGLLDRAQQFAAEERAWSGRKADRIDEARRFRATTPLAIALTGLLTIGANFLVSWFLKDQDAEIGRTLIRIQAEVEENTRVIEAEIAKRAALQHQRHSMEARGIEFQYSMIERIMDASPTALLHKSGYGQGSPFPGETHPTASVTGMPSAVKPFRTATRTWNSAT
ncbi:MAG: hypothetical protein ACXIUV_10390 [Alkalilacustris sp.]